MSNENSVHFNKSLKPKQGILQKPHDFEEHETPQHKIKWDENKIKQDEKQKEQVTMKVNEPNTPFVRYDAISDKVTNWQDLPETLRTANDIPDDDDFALEDNGPINSNQEQPKLDQWDLEDEKENKEKQEEAKQRHEEFLKKRAKHYYHDGLVFNQEEKE